MHTVGELLDVKGHQVWSITPAETVFAALGLMADKNIGALVVIEHDHLMGMISERDYARKIILFGKASKETPVSEIMSSPVFTSSPAESLEKALARMSQRNIRHLPVVDGERVVGVISMGDLVRAIMSNQEATIRFFEDLAADI